MFSICVALALLACSGGRAQEDEEGPYRGQFIGKFNSYHNQVAGEVYAVDDRTLLLVNFNYDGTGDDTFFWAGDSGRPGPQGFIVPDEHNTTNILERYLDASLRLRLPEGKRVSRLAWLCVFDVSAGAVAGDVLLPDEFEAPRARTLPPLAGAGAASGPVKILDSSTILISALQYDGSGGEVYFWTGVGPQPSAKGFKIPDEYGYLEPLGRYSGKDVRLTLPAGVAVRDVAWLALWDAGARAALAATPLRALPPVPPHAAQPLPYKSSLPHCRQLHRDVQVSWEVFGPQITVQLAAKMELDEYIAFGVSGSNSRSAMIGADVTVGYWDAAAQRAIADDYNVTEKAPCMLVLGAWRGVCPDEQLGGSNSNQLLSGERRGDLTVITYRRQLQPAESMDLPFSTDGLTHVVWALGSLGSVGSAPGGPGGSPGATGTSRRATFHRLYPKGDLALNLTAELPDSDCTPFSSESPAPPAAWETAELFDPALRVFTATVGAAGGRRGLRGRRWRGAGGAGGGGGAPALAWYINGQLAPDLQLRRGTHYTFKVLGGNDPHSATEYHPLYISSGAGGGGAALAGVLTTRRGRREPAAAGPLCAARHAAAADARRDDDFDTFRQYNRSLRWACAPGAPAAPAALQVAPDTTWPDTVYYHSFTHAGMGGRIFVVDRHKRTAGRRSSAAAPRCHTASTAAVAIALPLMLFML